MKNYIFQFDQPTALKLGLKLNELLLLDYLLQFINSGHMRYKVKDGYRYYKITYKKILEDLPILNVQERQLRNMIISLEKKGVLTRKSELKNELHIYVDFDMVFGNKMPDELDFSAKGFHDEGNGLLTIDYYDIKKIKIIHDNPRVREIDKHELMDVLYMHLQNLNSKIFYDCFIKDKLSVDEIDCSYIIFSVSNVNMLGKTHGDKFKEAFDLTINDLLRE